ncbi:T9SS type A sorting domain-containing protein [Bernardetia sp. ABR2-2B]|uniref:T9SS type A sorting domain-containing protein n=1 Tax=Bernardetia sp. ABR2-2B TaxID=3127472 RepID=UPI0030CBAE7D
MNKKRIYLSVLFFLFFSYAQAAIIYVDNDSQGNNNGQTWANAYHSLSTALSNANSGDIIRMDQGIYTAPSGGFILKDGVKIYGGYNVRYNNGTIIPKWLINATRFFGSPPATTIIEGNPVFLANQNLSNQTIIDGLILKSNNSTQYSNPIIGLISTTPITFALHINNCTFKSISNTSPFSRGISNGGSTFTGSFSPVINGCNFETMTGIKIEFGMNSSLDIKVDNTNFKNTGSNSSGNVALQFDGSTMDILSRPKISVNNSLLSNFYGLKLALKNVASSTGIISDVKITNSIFSSLSSNYLIRPFEIGSLCNVYVDNSTLYNPSSIIMTFGNDLVAANFNNSIIVNGGGTVFGIASSKGYYRFNNCLFNGTTCPTSIFGTNFTGTVNCTNSIFNQNPQFISTDPNNADYLKPSATSPARNAGNNLFATGKGYGGNDRILEGTVDIGAYEFCPSGTSCINTSPTGGGGHTSRKIATQNLENSTENLLVYPNPVKDIIKIKTTDKVISIELLSVQGQLINSTKDSKELNTQNIAKGMYLLKVTTDKGIQTKRIVKE